MEAMAANRFALRPLVRTTRDVVLLRAASSGDQDAVGRLLDDVAHVVYGYLYARVGGDADIAEDLLQETFLEGVRSANTFRGDASLSSWFCTIAKRRLARHYERERREAVARAGLVALSSDPVPPPGERVADRDQVIRALGTLPPVHRQVLVLKYLDGLRVSEIARELGRTRTSIQSLLQRARAGLRRALEADDGA